MSLHRRQLAVALAGAVVVSGLVYGFREAAWGGDESADAKGDHVAPQWVRDALAEASAARSLSVAIVLPEGKEAREALRAALEGLLSNAGQAAQVHLVEAVYFVCEKRDVDAKSGETAVLLDEKGRRVAGAAVAFTAEKFAETIRPLLRDGDRLAERAKAARTKEIEQAFADIDGKDDMKIAPAVRFVADSFRTAAPAVIEAYETAKEDSRLKGNLAMVLDARFRARRDGGEGRALAFGARWAGGRYVWDCPPCGRMALPEHGNVLEFLTREPGVPK